MDYTKQFLSPTPEQKKRHRPSGFLKFLGIVALLGAIVGIGWLSLSSAEEPATVAIVAEVDTAANSEGLVESALSADDSVALPDQSSEGSAVTSDDGLGPDREELDSTPDPLDYDSNANDANGSQNFSIVQDPNSDGYVLTVPDLGVSGPLTLEIEPTIDLDTSLATDSVSGESQPSTASDNSVSKTETASETDTNESQDEDSSSTTDSEIDAGVEEPVAEVAEALIPSIVSIEVETGFTRGEGSGVIYSEDGLIITAAHVVDGVEEVTVRFSDGEQIPGQVLGGNSNFDIAVVKVERDGLPAATLGINEPLRVGELVVAIGSPWGLQSSVTSGVISAVNRPLEINGLFRSMIQTDAPINPGNSGGVLADRNGNIIGINVIIYTTSGYNHGVGFAVPINSAYRVADSIVNNVPLETGFLGVRGAEDQLERGAVLGEIIEDTPAAEAGLEPGDQVVSLNGYPISFFNELAALIGTYQPGDVINLEILRDGDHLSFVVELTIRPEQNS